MPTWTTVWLEASDVASWLRLNNLPDPEGDPELVRVCADTELYVQRCRPDMWSDVDDDPDTPDVYVPDAEVYQGAVMYAARQYRRRNSPAGIEQFADGGTTFVSKYDSDIERALRVGTWNMPGVG